MCFSHMLWSPWYARYEVMTLLVMLMICIVVLLVSLGCICLWMAIFCKNAIWSSLVSWMPLMFKLCTYGYILLNLCLEPCSFYLRSKIHFSSWMFSLHATLWRSLSFILPQRHLMLKDRIGDQRGGEWMGADKNSSQELSLCPKSLTKNLTTDLLTLGIS
jgi:hypothetical protein